MNIPILNPYCSSFWRQEFPKIPEFQSIIDCHSHVIYSYQEANVIKAIVHDTVYAPHREVLLLNDVLDAQPFYYIQYLFSIQPQVILDVGCGLNPFQCFWPNIIGIDDRTSCPPPYDPKSLQIHVDESFSLVHQHMCDALISINAVHFSSIYSLPAKIQALSRLVRPGGRIFLATNLETWLSCTDKDQLIRQFGSWPNVQDIIFFMHEQIASLNLNLLVYDWPVLSISDSSPVREDLNGNIRLVWEVDS